jgi:hypothetical protein
MHVIDSGEGSTPAFRGAYVNNRQLFWRRTGYFAIYFLAALTPVWLFVLGAAQAVPRREALQLAIAACGLWPLAFLAMREGARIGRAMAIVERARAVVSQSRRADEARRESDVRGGDNGLSKGAIPRANGVALHEPAAARE